MKGNAEVVAVPRDEAYAGSVAPSDNAEAVMLDFVKSIRGQPAVL